MDELDAIEKLMLLDDLQMQIEIKELERASDDKP